MQTIENDKEKAEQPLIETLIFAIGMSALMCYILSGKTVITTDILSGKSLDSSQNLVTNNNSPTTFIDTPNKNLDISRSSIGADDKCDWLDDLKIEQSTAVQDIHPSWATIGSDSQGFTKSSTENNWSNYYKTTSTLDESQMSYDPS
jgi:hypothetical protein